MPNQFSARFLKEYEILIKDSLYPINEDMVTKIDEEVYHYFLNGIITNSKEIFHKKNRWNFAYYFIREMTNRLMVNGENKCLILNFHIPSQKLDINVDNLAVFIKMLHDDIFSKISKKSSGFPKWFKSLKLFGEKDTLEAEVLDFSRKFKTRILTPFGGKKYKFIKKQQDALDFIKGSMKKDKVIEILRSIDFRTPGDKSKRQMEYEFNIKRSEKLYIECKRVFLTKVDDVNNLDSEWKATRITKKKCLKFLLYWGLLGTISFRMNRGIEVSTERESAFFGFSYRIMREAMVSLGYINCTDPTYCISVRCKTFKVNVFMPKELVISDKNLVSLNNLEKEYAKLNKNSDKSDFMKYHVKVVEYLDERVLANEIFEKCKRMNRDISRNYFLMKKHKRWDNVPEVKRMQIMRDNGKREYESFIYKYSQAGTFNWNIKREIFEVA